MPTLRLVIVETLKEDRHAYVLDVKTAFLSCKLNEHILDQPQGYNDKIRRKCNIKISLNGLNQASRLFEICLEFVSK